MLVENLYCLHMKTDERGVKYQCVLGGRGSVQTLLMSGGGLAMRNSRLLIVNFIDYIWQEVTKLRVTQVLSSVSIVEVDNLILKKVN